LGSNSTEATYAWHTAKFVKWLADKKIKDADVTPKTIGMYFKDTGWSKSTTYVALAAMVRYFDSYEDMEDNPASHFVDKNKRKTSFKRLPVALDTNESELLLRGTHITKADSFQVMRIKMLIRLMYYTGLRQAEAATITVSACRIENEHPFIQVIGKGNKERIVPLTPESKIELETYISYRLEWLNKNDIPYNDYLFSHRDGSTFSGSGVYRMVDKMLTDCGITKPKMGPHILRHTFATRQLAAGVAPAVVKLWMGHSSMNILFKHYEHVINSPKGITPA
jgi:site-specific recombinase XerD